MRVGGRLQKAKLGLNSTHPIILSDHSHFTHLLVQHTHVQSLHAGPATVMSIIAGHYHVTRLRRLIRKISRHCTPCQKTYARTLSQRMGDLPADRVTPSPPFESVGIDYAGPMAYKRGPVRKPTMLKAYVAVFVCFSTKAAHLELVTDLKTETFLAALQRFIARRGLPSVIHSDMGQILWAPIGNCRNYTHFSKKLALKTLLFTGHPHDTSFGISLHVEPLILVGYGRLP